MKKPAEVFHPGEFIREEIIARGWTVEYLHRMSGIGVDHLTKIIEGRSDINPTAVFKLSRAFGTSCRYWKNLQASYDAHKKGAR